MRANANLATEEARHRGESVNTDMELWLEKANRAVSDVERLLAGQPGEAETGKCKTSCTDLSTRYKSSKRAVKLLKLVNALQAEVRQIAVSRPAPAPSIDYIPTGDFEEFEATRAALRKVIKALTHDHNKVIGVYGMGGVGKTSLIRKVALYAKSMNMFNEVVIATVSQNPDINKIQREIAEGLGLHLEYDTEHMRVLSLAQTLDERLKQGSRILIILDDVWDELQLSQVGIPSEMNDVANDIARECGGLPIALVTLGRVLRNRELRIWRDAASQLRRSRPLNIRGMHDKVFPCLKLSFEQARNDSTKYCFLYCALFPEDYNVRVEDLLRYGIGQQLFSDVETVDEARNRVHSIISNLEASCLLLNSNKEECVKMHDVFRDLAIFIGTDNNYNFMIKASSGLTEWPMKLNYVQRMSLIDNKFSSLSGKREYPELQLLLLQNNIELTSISDDFFEEMTALEVLDLSNIPNIVALPASLSCLTNLRTLCVEKNTQLQDVSALGGLTSLEILSLQKSSFGRFPEEIRALTNLRLLDLTDSRVDIIPAEVISSLCCLEELYMGGSFSEWKVQRSENEGRATLEEILSLQHLNTLHIDIENCNCLTEEITSFWARLGKFRLHIGDNSRWETIHSTSTCFNIPDQVPQPFMKMVREFLKRTLDLSIVRWKDLSSLKLLQPLDFQSMRHLQIQQSDLQACFSETLYGRFIGLQDLRISSCSKLETVFLFSQNEHQNNELPRLTRIHIEDAPRLTALWRGDTPSSCFQSLRHVKIELCMQIKSLFPLVIAAELNHLQYLEISECERMEAVICSGAHEIHEDTMSGQPSCGTNAALESQLTHTLFPQLQTLKLIKLNITHLTQPWFLLKFPALERVKVRSCPHLKKLPFAPNSLPRLNSRI